MNEEERDYAINDPFGVQQINKLKKTIAAQAAEIERLRADVSECSKDPTDQELDQDRTIEERMMEQWMDKNKKGVMLSAYFDLWRTHQMKLRGLCYSCSRCAHRYSGVCSDHLKFGCVYFIDNQIVQDNIRAEITFLQEESTKALHDTKLPHPERTHQRIEFLRSELKKFTV